MQNPTQDKLTATRARLMARAAELRERVQRVREDLRRDREPLPSDSKDAAIMVENDEVLRGIEATSVEELGFVGHALQRLDAGTFGICEACEGEIEAERLEAAPYATRCARCARAG